MHKKLPAIGIISSWLSVLLTFSLLDKHFAGYTQSMTNLIVKAGVKVALFAVATWITLQMLEE